MTPRYFIANWKMNAPSLPAWAQHMAMSHLNDDDRIILCPAFTQLAAAQMVLTNTSLELGAQDCHAEDKGPFTGDVSADMIKRQGCGFVIVGHSERRLHHGETQEIVLKKAEAALRHGLSPIVCIGESLQQYEAGDTLDVIAAQLKGIPESDEVIIAYEPVWAIGSGQTPSVAEIASMHTFIKKLWRKDGVVVYGGSVNAENASEILAAADVDGLLVGGASLDAVSFGQIVNAK